MELDILLVFQVYSADNQTNYYSQAHYEEVAHVDVEETRNVAKEGRSSQLWEVLYH